VLVRRGEALLLVLLGIPSAAVGWQIARTWGLPGWLPAILAGLLAILVLASVVRPGLKELAATGAVVVLYGLPILGAIVRWRLVAGPTALIGDGAYQIQLARNLLMAGIDPYGHDYTGSGLERAPWGQPFPNPALHHLDYWPGTIVLPLPVQAAFQFATGWWDERIWLLLAGVDITVISLWLGHESIISTQAYLHADMKQKEQAIAKTGPVGGKHARYKPPDQLLAFLENL